MYPIKEKPKIYVFGWIGRIDRISRISYDLIQSYVRSYHFYDPSAILNVLMRWDRKSWDPTIQIAILTTMVVRTIRQGHPNS